MTPDEIALVKDSFAQVVPIKEKAAELFYARLFEIDPTTRPLFADADIRKQGTKLMAALAMVVGGLDRPETIVPAAQDLARRHVGYGVTEAQYGSVGAALLWTLGQGLGAGFTPAVEAAWTSAYTLLSGVMIAAARALKPDSAKQLLGGGTCSARAPGNGRCDGNPRAHPSPSRRQAGGCSRPAGSAPGRRSRIHS